MLMMPYVSGVPRVNAAVGDVLRAINPTPAAAGSYCSIGIAFDGTSLYFDRCYDGNIYEISPADGSLINTFATGIAELPNALAFDAKRNGLWIGSQACNVNGMPIYFWDFDDNSVTPMFTIPFALLNPTTGEPFVQICFIDGLAYNENDPTTNADDEVWLSDDVNRNVGLFRSDGTFVQGYDATSVDISLSSCSGLAIGGANLYMANNGGGQVFRADRNTNPLAFVDLFVAVNAREEDMECDPVTFAPLEAMWVRTTPQGDPNLDLITAYEIEPGTCALGGGTSPGTPPRVSSTQKGSVLIYSKIEVKWDASGNLIQDTFLDISNDYPGDVTVQGYYINGDIELDEVLDLSGGIAQSYEPGWNTADCRFELTANQPHYWSAAQGGTKCQSFRVLDDEGPGRLDPDANDGSRILRGYAIFFAVRLFEFVDGAEWRTVNWNHLKGDAVLVNYVNGTAWEYNAWAFQARTGQHSLPVSDADDVVFLDGFTFDAPYASLILDFYASGSTVLSGGGQSVMVDTDLTLHAVSADFRQDGCGPVLTKVEAQIWNENESKFSGTRRCICCWDQTMLSDWVRSAIVPNHFMRDALRTDKGKARLDGVESIECDYEELCGTTAKMKRWNNCADTVFPQGQQVAGTDNGIFLDGSEDAAILGLATKFLAFTPSGAKDAAGMNLVGAGTEPAYIHYDPMFGPEEARDGDTRKTNASRSVR